MKPLSERAAEPPMTPMRHHESDTGHGLAQAILEYPFDLTVRLVYADWLEENAGTGRCPSCPDRPGKVHDGVQYGGWYDCPRCGGAGRVSDGFAEQAEFIRLQIEVAAGGGPRMVMRERSLLINDSPGWVPGGWTVITSPKWRPDDAGSTLPAVRYNNGFVEEVRCALGWWVGERCQTCGGSGMSEREYHGVVESDGGCPDCKGTGRTPGHGAEVVARHPVTRVVVTDREPVRTLNGRWTWHQTADWDSRHRDLDQLHEVPPGVAVGVWDTREAAETALSRALVDFARAGAGLPPISWEVTE